MKVSDYIIEFIASLGVKNIFCVTIITDNTDSLTELAHRKPCINGSVINISMTITIMIITVNISYIINSKTNL